MTISVEFTHHQLDTKTEVTAIIMLVLFGLLVAGIILYSVLQIKRWFSNKIYDVYRVMQYLTLIIFWISGIMTMIMMQFEEIVFYTLSSLVFLVYGFYAWEVVSLTWWINLIWQIDLYSQAYLFSPFQRKDSITFSQPVKKREKIMVYIWIVLFSVLLIPNFINSIYVILNKWGIWNEQYPSPDCPEKWLKVGEYINGYFKITAWACFVFLLCKIVIGGILTYKMSKNLNYYYKTKRFDILMTIISSWIVFVYQAAFIFFEDVRLDDIFYSYIVKKSMSEGKLITGIIIWLFEMFVPFIVMVFNVRTVNFK